eukprot:GILK01007509.1.p1 GENE.GILK01007509.1~~GILK01007509.1.p1  ORF type:complete len:805 (+),score=137.89 GILK01007509.1:154-2568(+)
MESENAACVDVTFQVSASLREFEVLHILGNANALGNWDADAAPAMVRTTTDAFGGVSQWSITVPLPRACVWQYKYLVKTHGSLSRWETVVGNRVVDTKTDPSSSSIRVDDGVFGVRVLPRHVEGTSTKEAPNYLRSFVDEGWLTPEGGVELRLMIGNLDMPAISLAPNVALDPYHFSVSLETLQQKINYGSLVTKHLKNKPNTLRNRTKIAEEEEAAAEAPVESKPSTHIDLGSNGSSEGVSEEGLSPTSRVGLKLLRVSDLNVAENRPQKVHDKGTPPLPAAPLFNQRTGEGPVHWDATANARESFAQWQHGDIHVIKIHPWRQSSQAIRIDLVENDPSHTADDHVCRIASQAGSPQIASPISTRLRYDGQSNSISSCCSAKILATAYILPSQFIASRSTIITPLVSTNGELVGELTLTYLVVRPFKHPRNDLSVVYRQYWDEKNGVPVGHRGSGRSFKQAAGFRKAGIPENTLLSFITAGNSGAEYVEFDVQLTADRIPFIFHDFFVMTYLSDYDDKNDFLKLPVHHLTLRQIRRARLQPVPAKSQLFRFLVRKHMKTILRWAGDKTSYEREKLSKIFHVINQMPTLEELFSNVPPHVGFNIEIKYPVLPLHKDLLREDAWLSEFDLNDFLDEILKCVFEHAGNRKIMFSCFDPDVCTFLRLKQPKYPVFFLSEGGLTWLQDRRCNSIEQAILFCTAERLQGIVCNSSPFLKQPALVETVKSAKLLLFTWGDENTHPDKVRLQRDMGIDGIISDNIGDITRKNRLVTPLSPATAARGPAPALLRVGYGADAVPLEIERQTRS